MDISPLRAPHGILYSEGKVYFTAELNKVIGRYDPATNAVDWVLGVGQDRTHMVIRTKFLNEFFTANVNSATVTAIVRVPSRPDGPRRIFPSAAAAKASTSRRTTRKSG